jgi:dihydrolipoamide dehydrogenase
MLGDAATKAGVPYQIVQTPWGNSGLAVALGCQNGMTILTFDPNSQMLLGVGVVGQGATELISELLSNAARSGLALL